MKATGSRGNGANISAAVQKTLKNYGVKVKNVVGLNQAQAATMLKLQDHLNSMINPDWINGGSRFLRAAFVESAEALEHYGWKWWKKQTIDLPQVQMELVDILHFYLSHTIVQAGGKQADAARLLMEDLATPASVTLDGKAYALDALPVPELLELIGGLAVCGRASYKVLEQTMTACEMGWNDAYTQYVSKNVLNIFRQQHGYKEGTYIKIWNGEEDNVVLARLLTQLDPASADFADAMARELEQAYARLK
ncbi:dUTP diphosphatase [Achromobacter piechaudii ATCC 43553]|uniref:dUTP diphosphatase n=1 Tax=Achromobacter piechaudii ATCC 43553 TaxID=742159 RepID=D4XF97_9BURK|nr:dUTP diphosphatase [Achromobacter piechaudii ATCC 43553]